MSLPPELLQRWSWVRSCCFEHRLIRTCMIIKSVPAGITLAAPAAMLISGSPQVGPGTLVPPARAACLLLPGSQETLVFPALARESAISPGSLWFFPVGRGILDLDTLVWRRGLLPLNGLVSVSLGLSTEPDIECFVLFCLRLKQMCSHLNFQSRFKTVGFCPPRSSHVKCLPPIEDSPFP